MKRILNFIFGLLLIVVVGTLLLLYIDYSEFQTYKEQLLAYNWFEPVLYSLAGLLLLIGLIFLIVAFKPSHRSRILELNYSDGDIFINKKSIEKNVLYTIRKYDNVRQPSINVNLFQKKNNSFMDVDVDLFVTSTPQIQQYLETIREDIKASAEHFAELPVRELRLNLLDQKTLKKRVL